MVNLNGVDLNLLLAFEALYEERHVGRAATRLGLSQPAASAALRRLRELFEDPLFLRGRLLMAPTPRAEQLAAPVSAGLAAFRQAFGARDQFHPPTSSRRFRLALTDLAEMQLFPKLVEQSSRTAPGVEWSIQRVPALFNFPESELTTRGLDAAIGFFPDARSLGSNIHSETLFEEQNVVVMRRGHPQARQPMTFDLFSSLGHCAVIYRVDSPGIIDTLMASRGRQRRLCYATPHFAQALAVVAQSDWIACLPERLARQHEKSMHLRLKPVPLDLPPFATRMLWDRRLHNDAGHRWLRERILELRA